MKRASLFILIICLCSTSGQAAFDNSGSSAKMMSLGNSSVALADEPYVFLANPGTLGFVRHRGIQAGLARLYDLDDLVEAEVSAVLPFRKFCFGAAWKTFGKKNYYQENQFVLAFGYAATNNLSVGLSTKLMQVSFSSEYSSLSAFSVDLGGMWRFNDKAQVGFSAKNLNRPELVKGSDDIPANFCLGLAVFPFKEVTLLLDLTYEDRYKEQLHLGQEITLVENIPLRFGIQTAPARYAFGVGFNLKKLTFDYAYINHSVLGGTHKINFSYSWGDGGSDQSIVNPD